MKVLSKFFSKRIWVVLLFSLLNPPSHSAETPHNSTVQNREGAPPSNTANEEKAQQQTHEEAAFIFQKKYGSNSCSIAAFDLGLRKSIRDILRRASKLQYNMLNDLADNGTHALLEEASNIFGVTSNMTEEARNSKGLNKEELTDIRSKEAQIRCMLTTPNHLWGSRCPTERLVAGVFYPEGGIHFRMRNDPPIILYKALLSGQDFQFLHYMKPENTDIPKEWQPLSETGTHSIYESTEKKLLGVRALEIANSIQDAESKDKLVRTVVAKLAFATLIAGATHGISLTVSGGSAAADVAAVASGDAATQASEALSHTLSEKIYETLNSSLLTSVKAEGQNKFVEGIKDGSNSEIDLKDSQEAETKPGSVLHEIFEVDKQLEFLRNSSESKSQSLAMEIKLKASEIGTHLFKLKTLEDSLAIASSSTAKEAREGTPGAAGGYLERELYNEIGRAEPDEHERSLQARIEDVIESEEAEKLRCQNEALEIFRDFSLHKSYKDKILGGSYTPKTDEHTAALALVKLIAAEESCFLRRLTLRLAKIQHFQNSIETLNDFCKTLEDSLKAN